MADLTLFDMDPETPREPKVKLSADRRRTLRQMAALERGRHPLSLLYSHPLALHPDAPGPHDREAPGPRCGTCQFRTSATSNGWHSFPKCGFEVSGTQPYVTFSAASDCRAWWPACLRYQPAKGSEAT